jgi:hypothetical protein
LGSSSKQGGFMIENQSEEQEQYPKRPSETAILSNGLFWPPGCAGKLAFFLYDCAYLPVPEIAIISTLAILAGLAGRSFNISGKGLNLYLILVAKSAIGKEHMSTGINLLLNATNNGFLEREFVIYDEFASGPALIKAVCDNPCMLNINGEFGHKLKGMATCTDNPSSPMYSLRKVITELYEKSGSSSKLGGIKYSNKDNNVTGIIAPAYSMLGDTTPGKFYEALTRDMMADGFMSRFTIVEYEGDRVRDNSYHQHFSIPSPELANWFKPFKQYCLECKEIKSVIYQKTGNDLLNAFKDECFENCRFACSR